MGLTSLRKKTHNQKMIMEQLEQLCLNKGLKMTAQRRTICQILSDSPDHPHVDKLYERVQKIDDKISIATIYRTLRMFEEVGILQSHDFGMGRAHYETVGDSHHDHLIDIETGDVIEFTNERIEALQEEVCRKLGYRLVAHKLELYAKKNEPIKRS